MKFSLTLSYYLSSKTQRESYFTNYLKLKCPSKTYKSVFNLQVLPHFCFSLPPSHTLRFKLHAVRFVALSASIKKYKKFVSEKN